MLPIIPVFGFHLNSHNPSWVLVYTLLGHRTNRQGFQVFLALRFLWFFSYFSEIPEVSESREGYVIRVSNCSCLTLPYLTFKHADNHYLIVSCFSS